MTDRNLVFVGTIASSNSLKDLCIYKGFLCVENGKITKKGTSNEFEQLDKAGSFTNFSITQLGPDQFIMPGFVDCHTHAPQFPNIGLGLDRPLLEWLAKYTFPLEKKYEDVEFAAQVYDKVVQRLLKNGTTTACYFGTIHLEGTLQLVSSAIEHGQRALVGKVSMNEKNDEGYYNETSRELAEVEEFVKKVQQLKIDLVQPAVTPRFAVSCDAQLMSGLAKIAAQYDCLTQSHLSENLKEIEFVLQKNPNCKSYSEVYDESQILNNKCIMAHAVHLSEGEVCLLAERGVSIAHCPASNTRLRSGMCPVVKLLARGLTVGLGTDVSGGDSASMLDAVRRAMDVSTYVDCEDSISWSEAFYLATLGGAEALSLDHKIGSLEVGKEFDALLVDVFAEGGPVPRYEGFPLCDHDEEMLQKFLYLGDDRNIARVYVQGVKVQDSSANGP